MAADRFRCGHPRTPENSTRGSLHRNGKRYPQCALCMRTRQIVMAAKRDQESINAGKRVGHHSKVASPWL